DLPQVIPEPSRAQESLHKASKRVPGRRQLPVRIQIPFGTVRVCTVKDRSIAGSISSKRLMCALERKDALLRRVARRDQTVTKGLSPCMRSSTVDETEQSWSSGRGR